MTTNMTKLAEAIGIISSVLSDEVAQSQHFVDVDDDDTVDVDEYNELKEIITDGIPDVLTDIETIKAEIEAAVAPLVTLGGIDDDSWPLEDDEVADGDSVESVEGETEPNEGEANEEKADVSADDLLKVNNNLIATLDMVDEQLSELVISIESLQDEVEER